MCSPLGDHPRIPQLGDKVLFVGSCYGEPERVTVVGVHVGDDPEDLNVWRWRNDPVTGQPIPIVDQDGEPVMVEWPNPNIDLVATDGRTFMTRQIRYRGSPGWTWPLYLKEGDSGI